MVQKYLLSLRNVVVKESNVLMFLIVKDEHVPTLYEILQSVKTFYTFTISASIFISQLTVNGMAVRACCVTAAQGAEVLMRGEDGQASPSTHTALCLSVCPPIISLMWPSP